LLAFDFDHVRDKATGELKAWAREILAQLDTYTEVTVSQEGVRAIGTVPPGWRGPIHRDVPMDQNGGHLEVFYNTPRFITISGDLLPGAQDELADISAPASEIIARLLPQEAARPATPARTASIDLPVHIDDLRDVVRRISPEIERREWVAVAHALKWEAGEHWAEEARQLFLDWSFVSERWGEDNRAGAAKEAYDSARPRGEATFGKLVYLAKAHPRTAAAKARNHIPMPRKLWHSPEVRGLSLGAKALLVELYYRYNGQNNGRIRMSWDEAQALLECTRRTVARYFAELHLAGLLATTTPERTGKGYCNRYKLTHV
jgi:hypothetical protein